MKDLRILWTFADQILPFFHLKQSITILTTVSKKHCRKISRRTRVICKNNFPNWILRVWREVKLRVKSQLWYVNTNDFCDVFLAEHIWGSINRINIFPFQLHAFIIVVREIMGRDKKGEHFWVEARKKPSRKSQTLKNFDEEWRKNLAVTDMDSWYEQSSLLTLEQPSTKVLLLGFSESWTFHSLEFLLLASIPNWTKLCHT